MLAFKFAACSLLCLALAFIMAVGMVFPVANLLLALAPCLGIMAILTAIIMLCSTAQQPWWNLAGLLLGCPSLLFIPGFLHIVFG